MGAVDILIVWENLEIHRILLKNHQTDGKLGKPVHVTTSAPSLPKLLMTSCMLYYFQLVLQFAQQMQI